MQFNESDENVLLLDTSWWYLVIRDYYQCYLLLLDNYRYFFILFDVPLLLLDVLNPNWWYSINSDAWYLTLDRILYICHLWYIWLLLFQRAYLWGHTENQTYIQTYKCSCLSPPSTSVKPLCLTSQKFI